MGEGTCNTNLTLGPGGGALRRLAGIQETPPMHLQVHFPTLPKDEAAEEEQKREIRPILRKTEEEEASKRNANETGRGIARKKLRLTKEQSALLENSFRERNTLISVKKQELADRLNLRPRQVEVWFQNRRARTKLKQTEMEYEILKKYCESLIDENRRLKKEIQELRFMNLPKSTAALTICPSCKRIAAGNDGSVIVGGQLSPMFYCCVIKEPPWPVRETPMESTV